VLRRFRKIERVAHRLLAGGDVAPLAAVGDEGAHGFIVLEGDFLKTRFDAGYLAGRQALGKRAVADIIEIGRRLTEAKAIAGHGEWGAWLERELGWSEPTAWRYVKVAELSKSFTVKDFNVDTSALYRLAAPSTPAEVVDAVADGSARGESFSREQVDGMISAAADKMEALASYARQAHDETLHNYAKRIQGRAVRRTGELLKEIEPGKAGRPPNEEIGAGARPNLTRSEAAADAGLSDHQRKTALRVASIPPTEFEAAVESDKPPTVTHRRAGREERRCAG
jgi:DUF3102 family protein